MLNLELSSQINYCWLPELDESELSSLDEPVNKKTMSLILTHIQEFTNAFQKQ